MGAVTEGRFSNGVPYLRVGEGPTLLVASGLSSQHVNPSGVWRRMALGWARPFAEHFTVHLVNRRPGLDQGTTMADLAADYATVVEQDIGRPVLLHGTSSGGSVGLQLAIDRPELVQRLVLAAAACRLSTRGLEIMSEVVQRTEAGDDRAVAALFLETQSPRPLAPAARAAGWLMGGMVGTDPTDMLATITAENTWDAEPQLHRVEAPTLVLGGSADVFYSEDLFRRTAAGIPDGRAVIFPGKSHLHVAGSKVPAAMALGFLLG